MKFERTITVEQKQYTVVLSDEAGVLMEAQAAGSIAVGLELPGNPEVHLPVQYVYAPEPEKRKANPESADSPARVDTAETHEGASQYPELPDEVWLERVVRRSVGLPWLIARTGRLRIREMEPAHFSMLRMEPDDTTTERIFHSQDSFHAYIQNQYRFYECGMWAVEHLEDDAIVGIAGVTPDRMWSRRAETCMKKSAADGDDPVFELGYHIFAAYRRLGYAEEACRAILSYMEGEYGGQAEIIAYVKKENTASRNLLRKLGFGCVGVPAGLYPVSGITGGSTELWRYMRNPQIY